MKRLRVTKLKLTNAAATDLQRLRLTPGDFDLVLSLGQKLDCANLSLRVFEAAQFSPNKRLQKLDGTILVINTRSHEVVAVCKNLLEVIQGQPGHFPTAMLKRIAARPALYSAWRKVRANRGAAGIDAISLKEFERNLEANLVELSRNLLNKTYEPLPVRQVNIPKRNGKEREL